MENKYISVGTICIRDDNGFEYRICKLIYELNQDETFRYTFIPDYSVIDLLNTDLFQGIPGLNLDLRCKQYVRENRTPVFISERVPSVNRVNLAEELERMGLTYIEPIQYLICSHQKGYRYSGDTLYVIPYEEKKVITLAQFDGQRNTRAWMKYILESLAGGDDVNVMSVLIDGHNRKDFFSLLLALYLKSDAARKEAISSGVEQAKKEGKYKGRKPIMVDMVLYEELKNEVGQKKITARQAATKLGISIDKYYRLGRKIQNNTFY